MLREDYRDLSTSEKILLVEEIWDSIAEDTAVRLSKEQKELLDERDKEILAGKISKKSWAEIKRDITSGNK